MAGRKPFNATAALRRDVELMKADGWSDDRVAAQLEISRTTLLKHFAKELEFGADKVRREQLRNLARAARKGSVPAANSLLRRADTIPGGSARPDRDPAGDDAPKAPTLGKKEQANLEAQNAAEGTSWANLIKH